jgi:threonine synthase
MKYISTRGAAPAVGFTEAMLGGLAPDGGLYAPQAWPSVSRAEIAAFADAPYADVAADILSRFAGDEIPHAVMRDLCVQSYATFTHAAVAPLKQLAPGRFLLELFHGPTLAFKDVAMQILARLYDHALAERGRVLTIVCATSGDTGGAAVEAFAGRANARIVALFPEGRISDVQRRFMTTSSAANVRAVAVAGDFDDCQAILKTLFQDQTFARDVDLSAVNSINFARIAAQSVYYFTAAASLGAPDRTIAFATPTGNFGDAYAGFAARAMGLPIARITAATNSNDIIARALAQGVYRRGAAVATQSPAMDIQVASNFERLYFEACGRDGAATGEAFRAFSATGDMVIPSNVRAVIDELFRGASVSEGATARSILATLSASGELVDPHTAVALAISDAAAYDVGGAPLVTLSTAHAAKFPEAVAAASGVTPTPPRACAGLAARTERFDRLPAEASAVKAYVRAFARG